jgi:hypothetical protein
MSKQIKKIRLGLPVIVPESMELWRSGGLDAKTWAMHGLQSASKRGYRARCTIAREPEGLGHVIFIYLEVMERPRAAPTADDTGVEDRVGAALRLCAMCALTR